MIFLMIFFRPTFLFAGVFLFCLNAECEPAALCSHKKIVQKVRFGRGLGWAIGNTKRSYTALKTTDGGRRWRDVALSGFWPPRTPTEISETDDRVTASGEDAGISFLSPNLGAFAAIEDDKNGDAAAIQVAYTTTAGRRWRLTQLHVPDWTASVNNFQIVDARHGFLLVLSEPAAGLMEKRVYRTTDGSRSWQLASDAIASESSFYPTGMVFRDASNGWITAIYHGKPDVPLYRSQDGGRTWHLQPLPEPAVYADGGYGNTNPPQFFGPQKRDGRLAVNYKNNAVNRFETITYITHDGGQTWQIGSRKRVKE